MSKDYIPPPSGGHSEKEKKVLDEVYSNCRSGQKVADKEKCAKIAWSAANKVKKMEFTKEDKDKLGQILKELRGIKDVLKGGEGSGIKGHKTSVHQMRNNDYKTLPVSEFDKPGAYERMRRQGRMEEIIGEGNDSSRKRKLSDISQHRTKVRTGYK